MAKILLVLPPLPQPMGAPYLGQQYIAASLLAAGHKVRCIDMAALRFSGNVQTVTRIAQEWQPDMIGMTLFTCNALKAYSLAQRLRPHCDTLVAGGPHVTILPEEAIDHGFDVAVTGEGEATVVDLLEVIAGQRPISSVPGVSFNKQRFVESSLAASNSPGCGPNKPPIEDLDALAFPLHSYPCFKHSDYSAEDNAVVPGGLMSSRGCPARCTFCANYVTGRVYRWRSPQNVIAEMVALKQRYGITHFSFWDDAFTARRSRLHALCEAIINEPRLRGATWSAITPANMVKPKDLALMRRAGCLCINFGIESGDAAVLQKIHKGLRPEQVRDAVAAAKALHMTTVVNFMFGFPGEDVTALDNTLALMKSLAAKTDIFNNRGVLVPFPGTEIYHQWHRQYGFTDWWLDPAMVPDEPNLFNMNAIDIERHLEQDVTLDIDFFHYSPRIKQKIEACVAFKAKHNRQKRLQTLSAAS